MKRRKMIGGLLKLPKATKQLKSLIHKEAIAYAEILASNNNGVVRVFAQKAPIKGALFSSKRRHLTQGAFLYIVLSRKEY